MTYFGLPYIHAVFDVAAWLASMTAFWLVTRHLLPADALPANRVPHPGAYAIAAGSGALCGAMFFGTANALLSGVQALGFSMVGGIAGAIASIEAFKRFTGVTRLDRHRLRRALCRHRGGGPLGLLLLRPRRLHLRHADRAAVGRRLRRRHRPPSGAALRILRHGRDVRRADPALPGARSPSGSGTAFTSPSAGTGCSASCGNS